LVEHHVANVVVVGSNPITRFLMLSFSAGRPVAILAVTLRSEWLAGIGAAARGGHAVDRV
jgi:hypothetical protein